ncbi:MAG: class E sortase, partial [Actinomycetota bacterium]
KGPGHYPGTPFPGSRGNAAIAGHRTTYGAPFHNVDKLKPGDRIIIETFAGRFVYQVTRQLIVQPTDTYVVANTPDAQLTLTSCHPKYSAAQRIVIKAKLVPEVSAKPQAAIVTPAAPPPTALAEGLEGRHPNPTPVILAALLAALVGLTWWWAYRRWRHPATLAGVIPFLAALLPFYVFLERVLPSGY